MSVFKRSPVSNPSYHMRYNYGNASNQVNMLLLSKKEMNSVLDNYSCETYSLRDELIHTCRSNSSFRAAVT